MTKTAMMFRVVEAWKRSGMGQQHYAGRIGMAYSTLQYWIRKYRQQHTSTALQHVAEFVPIMVAEPAAVVEQPCTVVITLASGTRIEVR